MLETYAQAEMLYPSNEDGIRLWSYAHMNIDIPWFFVRYEIEENEVILTSQFLLFDHKQIERLINNQKVTIQTVYLISPNYLNNSPYWSMDIIQSLVTGIEELGDSAQTIIRYELKDSTFYFYPPLSETAQFKKIADIYIASDK